MVFICPSLTLSSVVEPDGTVRTVKYTADKENGFQAQVYMNGKLVVHGNTGSGSEESGEGFKVTHTYQGSHSMEHPTIRSRPGTTISSTIDSDHVKSSEEGFGVKSEEDDFEDNEADDDEEDDDDEDED